MVYSESKKIDLDSSKNLVVSGTGSYYDISSIILDSVKITTVKYDNNGTMLWSRNFDFPNDSASYFKDQLIDSVNNIYIAGYTLINSQENILVFKYDSLGNLQWYRTMAYQGYDQGRFIRLDNNGNLIVFSQTVINNREKISMLKYDGNGTLLMQSVIDSASTQNYSVVDVEMDSLGNIYIGSTLNYSKFCSIKLNSIWSTLFSKTYFVAAGQLNLKAMHVDNYFNVYLGGDITQTSQDYFTMKTNSIGDSIWSAQYDNITGNTPDALYDIIADKNGNVYVTGNDRPNATVEDVCTIKYDSSGIQKWIFRYDSTGSDDFSYKILLDKFGDVYFAGTNHLLNESIVIFKVKPNGLQSWMGIYFNGITSLVSDFCIDDNLNVFVTGTDVNTGLDIVTIKFSQPLEAGITENDVRTDFTIYPNPFSTQTTLRTENFFQNATLTLDNCFGQTVAQIKNISGQTVTFFRDNLASGLYFVRLTEENKTIAVEKLVITDK